MRKRIVAFLTAVMALALCACGKQGNAADSGPQLQLTVTENGDAFTQLEDSEIRSVFNNGICFQGVENVVVSLDGKQLPLEDAIRQGLLDPETLRYFCSRDAKNGFCVQSQISYHGLNNETFHYPDYSLLLVEDLLEASDGEQYPVTYLAVYNHLGETSVISDFVDPATGLSVTREDWGVHFSVEKEADDLKVTCTQKAGMAAGTLKIVDCMILDAEKNPIQISSADSILLDLGDGYSLKMNDTTEIRIPLAGELPEEGCYLSLGIQDVFSDNHPLIKKYHAYQRYEIPLP